MFKLLQWLDLLTSIVFSSNHGIVDEMAAVQSDVFKRIEFIKQSIVFFLLSSTIPWSLILKKEKKNNFELGLETNSTS